MFFIVALLVLIAASWAYWMLAWWWTRSFFTEPEPLPDFRPPVSILKPVKGLDAGAYENFRSFCEQDYPDFELLFGVADPKDPVVPVVRRLQRDFPKLSIRLFVAAATGANRKASMLHLLTGKARYEVLAISDSDMRVTPDYLQRVVAPLGDEKIGMVTCCYHGQAPITFTAKLEALHMSATFLPSVMVGRRFLSMRFAMGATMVLRSGDLERIGGYAAVADHLLDDTEVALRLDRLGFRTYLSQYVTSSVLGATTFRDQWYRELRWSRTNRVSRPIEYPIYLITFTTPLAVALVLASGLDMFTWPVLGASLALRWFVAWRCMGYVGDPENRRWLVWLPLRDMLSGLIWTLSLVGRRIVWRGEEYIILADGRLRPMVDVVPVAAEESWCTEIPEDNPEELRA